MKISDTPVPDVPVPDAPVEQVWAAFRDPAVGIAAGRR